MRLPTAGSHRAASLSPIGTGDPAGYYPYLYGKLEEMLEAIGEEPVVPKAERT